MLSCPRLLRRFLSAGLLLVLAAPSPALALRPTGLEESSAREDLRSAFLDAAGASKVGTLDRLATVAVALRRHPGGNVESYKVLREFLEKTDKDAGYQGVATDGLTNEQLQAAVETEDARRLRENLGRRGADHPRLPLGVDPLPLPLIALNVRTRLINFFQTYLGGRLTEPELAEAVQITVAHLSHKQRDMHLDYRELLDADNAIRLEANVARRAADLPLLPLIVMDDDTALLNALQRCSGGYLRVGELAASAEVPISHTNRLGWHANDDAGHVAAENARRQRANALRRRLGKPPIPRIAHDMTTAIRYALKDYWWNVGKDPTPTPKQLAAFANVSVPAFQRHLSIEMLAEANVTRAAHHLPPLPTTLVSSGWEESNQREAVAEVLNRTVPAASELIELSKADRLRRQQVQGRILNTLTDSRTEAPPGGRVTPAWILQTLPGTRYQDGMLPV